MDDFDDLTFTKFSVGQSVSRFEDPELLRGEGTYTDDIKSNTKPLEAFVYRSPYAHGKIIALDTDEAKTQPGIVDVLTFKDMDSENIGPIPCLTADKLKGKDGNGIKVPPLVSLAKDKVYYVGQPIAFIIADTLNNAKNASELISLEIEELDVIVDPRDAIETGASAIHPTLNDNIALDWEYGDESEVDKLIQTAKYKTSIELRNSRLIISAMEPRACMASFDQDSNTYDLHSPSQGLFGFANILANIFNVERDQMHCHTPSVGGSFGMKSSPYPEYIASLVAAKKTGKTIKWKDTRTDSFLSDTHGRDSWIDATIAFDDDMRMIAAKIDVVANSGAFMGLMGPMAQSMNIKNNFCGAYDLPKMYVNSKAVYTNTTPIGAYRGAGRPEGVYIMERLLEKAAIEMKVDPVELRKINLIQKSQFPYQSAAGLNYDSGDFHSVIEDALETADWVNYDHRAKESMNKGLYRGRALTYYLEVTAPPGKEMGRIRFGDNDDVTLISGNLDYGQGHLTSFAQIMSDKLGIPMKNFKLLQGDSKELIAGTGTGGSRTAISGGTLLLKTSNIVISNGKKLAAHLFEERHENVEFNEGNFEIPNTNHKINILELNNVVKKLLKDEKLPKDLPQGLDGELAEDTPPSSFPNGCHISEVEINPKTGVVKLIKHTAVNDFGNLINPLLVEGQVLGGIIQAQGQIMMENLCYDDYGQLLSGSYMDYTMPKAIDIPREFVFKSHPIPCETNPLGIKGCGEAGISGALPTIMNAIVNALESNGVDGKNLNMPVTSEKMWEIIN